jgi:DNA-binding CsgD family transcriptional regulator
MDTADKIDGRACVAIVAADPLRSLGLLTILETMAGFDAVPMELEAALADASLAAVLIDSRSTGDKLTETVGRLRREKPAVIASGAKGYLAETAGENEIRMAMEVVLDGSVWAPRKVLAKLIDAGGVNPAAATAGTTGADGVEQKMTPREMDVLRLLMDGRSNRDIASAMGIDEVTVKAHLGRMLRKTGASNRVELTLRAMEERGLAANAAGAN